MNKDDALYLYGLANLWRCDCPDDGYHVDADYHDSNCKYGKAYLKKKEELEESEED